MSPPPLLIPLVPPPTQYTRDYRNVDPFHRWVGTRATLTISTLRFSQILGGEEASRYTYADERGEPDRLHRYQVP
jgi:hypothetical protein